MAIKSGRHLTWTPVSLLNLRRPSFREPWSSTEVADYFRARAAFCDGLLAEKVLSADERDELTAQRDVFEALNALGPQPSKTEIMEWLSSALAEHLVQPVSGRRGYALSHLSTVSELTEAVAA